MKRLIINGHFRAQQVTGVQRYAHEVIAQFDKQRVDYGCVRPPALLHSDALRQLWMQAAMPFKIRDDALLWSPTNIGPVWCRNQVLTLHDIADQLHPEWFDRKYVNWRKLILPKLLHRVRRVITVSHFSRDTIIERFPQIKNKTEVIYNGVQHALFYPRGKDEINTLREHFNLPKPFILSVGSLDGRKNVRGLMAAWRRLPGAIRSRMDLVIAGASASKFNFYKDEDTTQDVHFLGYVKDDWLPILYSAARVFAYPSVFEGFGLPVLEAMACGAPVVTSNTTSLKELAEGKALTVDPTEPEAMALALEQMITFEALRKRYIAKGKAYVQAFTWDETAKQTRKVLQESM